MILSIIFQESPTGRTWTEKIFNLLIQKDAPSMHETAEWRMQAIQSYVPCINGKFIYEERSERKITVKKITLSKTYDPVLLESTNYTLTKQKCELLVWNEPLNNH